MQTNVFPSQKQRTKRALLYYKADVFQKKELLTDFRHTNNSEIYQMAKILDQSGFEVDVVDRSAEWEDIQKLKSKRYDLFLSNAAGNSARYHQKFLNEFNLGKRIVFAAGPEPIRSNELVNAQHENFKKRSGVDCVVRRLVTGDHFAERFQGIDAIFYVGNDFSKSTYEKFGIPLFPIHPSSSPRLKIEENEFDKKSPKHFIYVGGTGLICKGLDLVLETFDGLSNLSLDICGPADEKDFWDYYAPLMKRNPQIRFHGFVDVNGPLFHEITSRAAFYLFPSSAEGCATSVTTCMRRGVIPIINFEVGVDTEDFGYLIADRTIPALRKLVKDLSETPKEEIIRRTKKTFAASERYTQAGFTKSFTEALRSALAL